MGYSELMQIPELAERFNKLRPFFRLRESTYDVTSVCQLRCDGCYYFQGDKYRVEDNREPSHWRNLFLQEKERGINFVILAGAEPALAPKVLSACYEVIPNGVVASNGLKKIDPEVNYRVHLSIWGGSEGDPKYRKYAGGQPGPNCLPVQLKNYRYDNRVCFIYTFNDENVDEVDEVLKAVAAEGHKLSFNIFSDPLAAGSPLKLKDSLGRIREKMFWALETYPETVVYSNYNAIVHTNERALHERLGCVYPRAVGVSGLTGIGIGKTFRSYRADLTHTIENNCCVPDIDCRDCRHYAAGSAIVTSRLNLHVGSEDAFRGWLDYVDTYLAVWVLNYQKSDNLFAGKDDPYI
jgi:hypothetical protein